MLDAAQEVLVALYEVTSGHLASVPKLNAAVAKYTSSKTEMESTGSAVPHVKTLPVETATIASVMRRMRRQLRIYCELIKACAPAAATDQPPAVPIVIDIE